MEFFREKAKELRKQKKIKINEMAKILGVSANTVSSWERKERNPSQTDVRVLAQVLGVNVDVISDLAEINYSTLKTGSSLASSLASSTASSFVTKIESSLSIQDRILLNGISAELHALQNKVREMESVSSPSETIANKIHSFIYKKDINSRFIYINKSYLKHLNVESSMILGRNNKEVFGWQEAEMLDELEAKAMKGFPVHNMEVIIPGSMKKRHGLFSASSIYGANGTLKEVIFKIDDVTDRFEIFDKYKTLENVIHSSNEILWIKQNDGSYPFIGAPIHSISGYFVNEFLHNPYLWLTNVVEKHDRERVGIFYRACESGDSISYKIRTKDNKIKSVKEKIFYQERLTFGTIQDITEESKVQEDKQLLLDIINAMPEAVWIADDYGGNNIRILSPSISKLTGIPQAILKAQPEKFPNYIHEKDREKYKKWAAKINNDSWWKNETKKSMCEKIAFRVVLRGGRIRYLEDTVYSTLKFKKQGVKFGIFKDVTKEHEQQLEMKYLFECVNDMDSMFWVARLNGNATFKYITISDGVKKIYNMTKAQFARKNKTLNDMLHLNNKELVHKPANNTLFPLNSKCKTTINGKNKWLQERIYKKENLLFGLISDITEQKESNWNS